MMNYVPLLLIWLSACVASNGTGHERLVNGYQERSPGTAEVILAETNPVSTESSVDGQWWCFDLHAPRPEDGESDCSRSKDGCEQIRKIAVKYKRKPSKQCTSQRTAFCFAVQLPKMKRVEVCLRTGEQCEALEKKTRRDPNAQVWPCAEQTNDKPPSGGVF